MYDIHNKKGDKKMAKETEEKLKKLLEKNLLQMEVFEEGFGVEKIVITKKKIDEKSSIIQNQKYTNKLNRAIEERLIKLGIPGDEDGYKYLHEAIRIGYEEENSVCHVNRLIYPIIAKKFSVTSTEINKKIKEAIKMAWSKAENVEEQKIFKNVINQVYKVPTNVQLIGAVVNELQIFEKRFIEEDR